MLDYLNEDLVCAALKSLNGDIEVPLKFGVRNAKNCVSPSQLKNKSLKSCMRYMFDPFLLAQVGIITYDEANSQAAPLDAGGVVNCSIGNTIHFLIQEAIGKAITESFGHTVKVEHPVFSEEYKILGTADMVVIDRENQWIDLIDLKTTGPAIVQRATEVPNDYKNQLAAYLLCLSEMYDIPLRNAAILSVCKIPNSGIYMPENLKKPLTVGIAVGKVLQSLAGSTDEAILDKIYSAFEPIADNYVCQKISKLNLAAIYVQPASTFITPLQSQFKALAEEIIRVNLILKEQIEGYTNWTVDEKEYEKLIKKLQNEYNSL